eukprot:4734305-Pyramimonas_sp.AAC.1
MATAYPKKLRSVVARHLAKSGVVKETPTGVGVGGLTVISPLWKRRAGRRPDLQRAGANLAGDQTGFFITASSL